MWIYGYSFSTLTYSLLHGVLVVEDMSGPDGEDWRVPVKELEARLEHLSQRLARAEISGALIQNPVDLYYYAGGRQNGALFVQLQIQTLVFTKMEKAHASSSGAQ